MTRNKNMAAYRSVDTIIMLISVAASYYLLTDIDILKLDTPFLQKFIIIAATMGGLYEMISRAFIWTMRYLGKLPKE